MFINIIYILIDTKVFVKEKILDPEYFVCVGMFGQSKLYLYIFVGG